MPRKTIGSKWIKKVYIPDLNYSLSGREIEVMELCALRDHVELIAEQLFVTENVVRRYINSIQEKVGKRGEEFILYCQEYLGIPDPNDWDDELAQTLRRLNY